MVGGKWWWWCFEEGGGLFLGLKKEHQCNTSENRVVFLFIFSLLFSLANMVHQLGPLEENVLAHISYQIVHALAYLRRHLKRVHRDIKPSNVLINSQGKKTWHSVCCLIFFLFFGGGERSNAVGQCSSGRGPSDEFSFFLFLWTPPQVW